MEKIYFGKERTKDALLAHFSGYAVDSQVYKSVTYLAKNHKCGLMVSNGIALWPEDETESVIARLQPELQEEAKEIFAEAKDWRTRQYGLG